MSTKGDKKPNIVFILIDDMGWADLGCYGSSFYETPNLDALARSSMRFTDAYAACPVCSPTRASLMTGKYPARIGLTNYIHELPDGNCFRTRGKLIDASYITHLPKEEYSIAAALRDGGYATWHVGKWHLGPDGYWPKDHGFDVNVAGCDCGMPHSGYVSPWNIGNLENGEDGEYLTDRLTDHAVELIENHDDDKPFYLNLCYYAVHVPIEAKDNLVEKYRKKAESLGLNDQKTFEEGEHFPCEHKKDKRLKRRLLQSDPTYAAMIETLDTNIGRVLKALDDRGCREDTMIVFTSDNGGLATAEGSPTCNAPLSEGKGWMYDGGVREPLLVSYPGVVEAASECDLPVSSPDFYPTFLELASLEARKDIPLDGVSIMPLLRGADEKVREQFNQRPIFWHYPHYGNQGGTPGCSVRLGDWKLIEFFEDGRLELYNLREDISEEFNLAGSKPGLAAELHTILVQWRESVEAVLPEKNPDWPAMAPD